MGQTIKWIVNTNKNEPACQTDFLCQKEILTAKLFHESFPEYSPTPLRRLGNLARYLGVAGVYVKDERYRFGLKAFNVLGCSYAVACWVARRLESDIAELTYTRLTSDEIRRKLGEITFTAASTGNHGRALAWTARLLKQKAVICLPKGMSASRQEAIHSEGAETVMDGANMDMAVVSVSANARKNGWVLLQDTVQADSYDVCCWMMQGYGTMAAEAQEQLQAMGVEGPTHVLVQAGSGSLAGAIQGYFASTFGSKRPQTVVVEASQADCLYQSVLSGQGEPCNVFGDLTTVMTGLARGRPHGIGWNILRTYSDMFASCPDWVAAKGMRVLGNPLENDDQIISGESGAVTAGFLAELMTNKGLAGAKNALGLDKNSVVLLFSTEGDVDPQIYRDIVWGGQCPAPGQP